MKRSLTLLFLALPMLGACSSTATKATPAAETADTGASSLDRLFPLPTEPLRIHIEAKSGKQARPTSFEDLLAEMERITSVRFVVGVESRLLLGRTAPGILQSLVVPPARAWSVFEALLLEADFLLEFVSTEEPIMLSVSSIQPVGRGQGAVALGALKVDSADLARWKNHPAFIITTSVDLNELNVRDLSNTIRQLFSNPLTMQVVPLGNSNSLMISGSAGTVANVADLLLDLNEAARVRHEKEAKLTQEERDKAAAHNGVSSRK